MAEAKLSPVFEMIRGTIGEIVIKRYGNRVIISKKPEFINRTFSHAQKNHQKRFREASEYAKRAFADPEMRRDYEKAAHPTGKPILSLMIGDFFHPPTIERIDTGGYHGRAGGKILIQAMDDFEVVRVEVAILDDADSVLERDVASPTSKGIWTYLSSTEVLPKTEVTIEATATDRPGHATILRTRVAVE